MSLRLAPLAAALFATGCIILDPNAFDDGDPCLVCADYEFCSFDDFGNTVCTVDTASRWSITIGQVEVPGTQWDALGDPPDLRACLISGTQGAQWQCTLEASNTNAARFSQMTQFTAGELLAAPVTFQVDDIDALEDDVVGSFQYQFTLDDFRKGGAEQAFERPTGGIQLLTFTLERLP